MTINEYIDYWNSIWLAVILSDDKNCFLTETYGSTVDALTVI